MSNRIFPQPKPVPRWKNREYLEMVAKDGCFYCKHNMSGPPRYIRRLSDCGGRQKPHDYLTVGVCYLCHDAAHNPFGAQYERYVKGVTLEDIKIEVLRLMWKWLLKGTLDETIEYSDALDKVQTEDLGEFLDEEIALMGGWMRGERCV